MVLLLEGRIRDLQEDVAKAKDPDIKRNLKAELDRKEAQLRKLLDDD